MIEDSNPVKTDHKERRYFSNGWSWLMATTTILLIGLGLLVFIVQPWGPSSAWAAADHNRDGILTRDEMSLFITQKPHRTDRLLMHFDAADVVRSDTTKFQTETIFRLSRDLKCDLFCFASCL